MSICTDSLSIQCETALVQPQQTNGDIAKDNYYNKEVGQTHRQLESFILELQMRPIVQLKTYMKNKLGVH